MGETRVKSGCYISIECSIIIPFEATNQKTQLLESDDFGVIEHSGLLLVIETLLFVCGILVVLVWVEEKRKYSSMCRTYIDNNVYTSVSVSQNLPRVVQQSRRRLSTMDFSLLHLAPFKNSLFEPKNNRHFRILQHWRIFL